jgi:hypothetical protein
MVRFALLALALCASAAACDDGASKAKEAVNKADKAVDKAQEAIDGDEAGKQLAAASQAFAAGKEAPEACSWARSAAADQVAASGRASVATLRDLCELETPLARALAAVEKAEKARAEQPQAPTLTECQSETWSQAAASLDGKYADNARWTGLKARWAKACP